MSEVWIKIDFLEEKEEFGLERQNAMSVGWPFAGCGWLGWSDHCP